MPLERMCWVPIDGEYIPVISVDRARAKTPVFEKAREYRTAFVARRSRWRVRA